jgi:hypothetical protein
MKPAKLCLWLVFLFVVGPTSLSPQPAQAGATETLRATGCPIKQAEDGGIVAVDLSERPVDDALVDALAALPKLRCG